MAELLRLLLGCSDGAAVAQFTVVDANVEAAIRITARPGLVGDRRAVATIVAERKQRTGSALSTPRKLHRFFHAHPSHHHVPKRARHSPRTRRMTLVRRS